MVRYQISSNFSHLESDILAITSRFEGEGVLVRDIRNVVKIFDIGGVRCVVKSFKLPNIVNRVVYAHFRKSKAQRSFENAHLLMRMGILTPEPVAYIVLSDFVGVTRSYYISLELDYDFDLWCIVRTPPHDAKQILLAFTHFIYMLQELCVFFKDNSPGNTLIRRDKGGGVRFYLVDLNRLEYRRMTPRERLLNLSRLALRGGQLDLVAREFSKLIGVDYHHARRVMSR